MFVDSQMHVLATTTLLVTVRWCDAEPRSLVAVLGDPPAYVADAFDGPYQDWPAALPEQTETETRRRPWQSGHGTVPGPSVLYPLFVRLAAGEAVPGHTRPASSSSSEPETWPEQPVRVAAPAETGAMTSVVADVDGDRQSSAETPFVNNASHPHAGQMNNSVAIEYLPTIAVPFLDGIIGGIQQHVQLIKPGTKWCGDGNKARSYEDVGVLYKTDKCCRNHDKCPYYILSHETKYGLHNDAHFTRSHCDCDESFYDCLKKANSPFSTGVGITYFNILKMKCFRREYPLLMCTQSAGWISKYCVEYIVDVRKKRKWQWFDNHEF